MSESTHDEILCIQMGNSMLCIPECYPLGAAPLEGTPNSRNTHSLSPPMRTSGVFHLRPNPAIRLDHHQCVCVCV